MGPGGRISNSTIEEYRNNYSVASIASMAKERNSRRSGSGGSRDRNVVGDRHRRAVRIHQNLHVSIELLGECLDDAGAQPGSRLIHAAVRRADPIVGNRKPPVHLRGAISDDYLAVGRVIGEAML